MKGAFGYLKAARIRSRITTLIFLGISIGLYLLGTFLYHHPRNLFSILAALCCIPTGLSAVRTVMYQHARPCSDEAHEQILRHAGGLLVQYDLMMTGENRNFPMEAVCALEDQVLCFTGDTRMPVTDAVTHIKEQLALGGYPDCNVTVTNELDTFCARLNEMEEMRAAGGLNPVAAEEAWQTGTAQTVAGILRSISL